MTAAVVLFGGAGATGVFVAGSNQRRDDRRSYLAYEQAALVPILEAGRIVEQQMKPSLDELRQGQIDAANALRRAAGWRSELTTQRAALVGLAPPSFLADIASRWGAAMDGYLAVVDLFDRAARANGPDRITLLNGAADAGARADKLFDAAASVMQFQRKRLGLGATSHLPDNASAAP